MELDGRQQYSWQIVAAVANLDSMGRWERQRQRTFREDETIE